MRILLNGVYIMLGVLHEFTEELCLQLQYLVFGSENLLLILFQFLGDISFRLCERLLPYPCGRHFVFVDIPHFKIISEHIVVAYFQT